MRSIPALFVVLLALNAYAKDGEILLVFPKEIKLDKNDELQTKIMSKTFSIDDGYCQLNVETPPNAYRVIEAGRKLIARPTTAESFSLVDPNSNVAVATGYCYSRDKNPLLRSMNSALGSKPADELRRIPVNLETEEKDASGQTIAI